MTTATAPGDARPQNVRPADARRGVALALAAVLAFTVMDSLLKRLTQDFPVMEVFLFRWTFALPPILWLVWRDGGWGGLRTRRMKLHGLRSVLSTLALGGFIYAFGHMQLADVVAISFAAPLMMTAMSVPLLGEKVDGVRWAAVIVGFAGVLVIARPGSSLFGLNALIALAATTVYAIGIIIVRKLGSTESTAAMSFYLAVSSVLTGLLFIPFGFIWPTPYQWVLLALLGTIGGTANMLVTAAYRCAPVATVAPLDYTLLIGTTAIGYFVFGEMPDVWVFAGAAIVTASGIFIIRAATRR